MRKFQFPASSCPYDVARANEGAQSPQLTVAFLGGRGMFSQQKNFAKDE
jgi:hypothetical protein